LIEIMTATDRPFAELTDKQRECLRLASQHMSSKEIARVLGISASAVEQRLKYAVRALGARDRREAARLFSQWEQGCGEITYGPAVVEDASPSLHPAATGAHASDAWERPHLADSAGFFDPKWDQPVGRATFLPLPGNGRSPALLGKGQRALWIGGITLCFLLVFGVFVAGLEALSRLHG
jgi:DNA-binding CsgD family transcriptional regulator